MTPITDKITNLIWKEVTTLKQNEIDEYQANTLVLGFPTLDSINYIFVAFYDL